MISSVVELALKKLKSQNIDSASVGISEEKGFSVSVRNGDVETLENHLEKSFGVTVYINHQTGSASSSDFSEESIDKAIAKACSIASFANPDLFSGLPDKDQLAIHYPDCKLYFPWEITPAEAIERAIAAEKIALSFDPRIQQCEGASIGTYCGKHILANTLGFIGEYQTSSHNFGCSVVASLNNKMQTDSDYTVSRNPADLENFEWVAKKAAEKTIARLNSRSIKTQSCPVIFEASVAKSLLGSFIAAISGGSLYRRASFLVDSIGKIIFPTFINIAQEPHLFSAMGSAPFDSEGVATKNVDYIKNGELVSYVLGSYSARKLNLKSTGNAGGIYNLSITHTNHSLKELFKKMGRGLLVTELMGQGTNITTGDYSRGAAGFWIDNGEIQFPVEEITIAGNLKNMLAGIVEIANDTDTRGSIRTGSILIDQMTIAGS